MRVYSFYILWARVELFDAVALIRLFLIGLFLAISDFNATSEWAYLSGQ